jgi:hypothetical protein
MTHLQDFKHLKCVPAVSVNLISGHAFQIVGTNFVMTAILDIFIQRSQRVLNAFSHFVLIKNAI